MEKQVLTRDYQEFQSQDVLDLQDYARKSFDDLIKAAVTSTRRFSGFAAQKTAQVEVQVQAGLFYDTDGAVYSLDSPTTQSLLTYLAVSAKRIVRLSAYGTEVETDTEERDFLVDPDTDRTEPRAVTTTNARQAVLSFTAGTESAIPIAPTIPVTNVAIADILVDSAQIVSVTMLTANEVTSTEDLDLRTDSLEDFAAGAIPTLAALAMQIAELKARIASLSQNSDLVQLYIDMARVKERLELPETAVDYGADRFLDDTSSDTTNALGLGPYTAHVMEGIRFDYGNSDSHALDVYSDNDADISKEALALDLLMPKYSHEYRYGIQTYYTNVGIAQYKYTTHDHIQKTVARQRIRYGDIFTVCTNSAWWQSGVYDPIAQTFRIGDEVWNVLDVPDTYAGAGRGAGAHFPRLQKFWYDTYNETYWEYVTVTHTVTGATVGQTFLNPNDMWLTKVRLYFTSLAANANVFLSVCETTNGMPDITKTIMHQEIDYQDIEVNDWTDIILSPTFLAGGQRYALVLVSNADHHIGMADANNSGSTGMNGSFFYSLDDVYYLGYQAPGGTFLDMMMEVYGAKFEKADTFIRLNDLSLSGGITSVDLLYGAVMPKSTGITFQALPQGSTAWKDLSAEDTTVLNGCRTSVQMRVHFAGGYAMQPAIQLGANSNCFFCRPAEYMEHVSTLLTLQTPASYIHVRLMVENYDDGADGEALPQQGAPHWVSCRIHTDSNVWVDADTIQSVCIDADAKRYELTYNFVIGSGAVVIEAFAIEITGRNTDYTNNNCYHVAERVFWTTSS